MSQAANDKIKAGTLFSVDGLVVVITGGGSGLGSMMARSLALNGASKVFIIGRREESLKTVAASVAGAGGNSNNNIIIPVVGDVTSKESLSAAVSTIKSTHGVSAIDVLIANSGISGPAVPFFDPKDQSPLPIAQVIENMWKPDFDAVTSTYAVNLTGVHFTVAAFLPLLVAANEARPHPPSEANFKPRPQIITTGSIGGYNRRPLGNISYSPSKAAVIHLTKMLSTALVPYDIRANVIAPGLYLSEMTQGMYRSQGREVAHNVEGTWGKEVVPATRTGDESDMAGVVLWLCSRAGAYLNGNVAVTDGGRLSVMSSSY